MEKPASIRICSALDHKGVDGVSAARLLHFGAYPRFEKFIAPLSPLKEEAIRAFIDHAVSGSARAPRHFTEDFGPEALENPGWCGTVTHPGLTGVIELLSEADEVEVSGSGHGEKSTIRTLGQCFVVQAVSDLGWDLMQEIHLGAITLRHEIRPGDDAPHRLRSVSWTRRILWFWQERRAVPVPFRPVPEDWHRAKAIPAGYLALAPVS